ncbi:cupin domain-containing protein [Streptomyces acidiscabies]|uniref:Cupin n=1 Tax=Streptomyces acidiscabies TaxID=42234 RepID=A0A0L0K181_9ACTN|nr:cupin domain-containing protein [Streptomyces acidiscabies]KND31514.1 cupin [Streptomyces acidiscabies]
MTPDELISHYSLQPIPREGGLFHRTWTGPPTPDGRPSGTAIVVLLKTGDYSALHRLPHDETWHHYLGAPLEMLLLAEDGSARTAVLGPDILGGQAVQLTVPARTWMGARPVGGWTFFGCTMAPGFTYEEYEHGELGPLTERYPSQAERIAGLCRR